MLHRTISICYRKVIGPQAATLWEQYVFEDTYAEFRLQAQLYTRANGFRLFSELLQHVARAGRLHHLVSAAAIPYLKQLNGLVPDMPNALGKLFLPFEHYRFEIVQSDTEDRQKHAVAITFYSHPVHWLDTIGDRLLLSLPGKAESGALLTEMLQLPPFASIYSIKQTS